MSKSFLSNLLASNKDWAKTLNPQEPKVLWIGCSDSRVPESVITNSLPGQIFVHRNIANQVQCDDDNGLSAVFFAITALKVEHVVIVGHSGCGGVQYSLKKSHEAEKQEKPASSPLDRWLAPLITLAENIAPPNDEAGLVQLIKANVEAQVKTLTNQVAQAQLALEQTVWVHGLVYELNEGLLTDLNVSELVPQN